MLHGQPGGTDISLIGWHGNTVRHGRIFIMGVINPIFVSIRQPATDRCTISVSACQFRELPSIPAGAEPVGSAKIVKGYLGWYGNFTEWSGLLFQDEVRWCPANPKTH